jgi:hypothetical protein
MTPLRRSNTQARNRIHALNHPWHSTRAGGVTEAGNIQGTTSLDVQAAGGWADVAMAARYTRDAFPAPRMWFGFVRKRPPERARSETEEWNVLTGLFLKLLILERDPVAQQDRAAVS